MKQALLVGFVLVAGVFALHPTLMASPGGRSRNPVPGIRSGF